MIYFSLVSVSLSISSSASFPHNTHVPGGKSIRSNSSLFLVSFPSLARPLWPLVNSITTFPLHLNTSFTLSGWVHVMALSHYSIWPRPDLCKPISFSFSALCVTLSKSLCPDSLRGTKSISLLLCLRHNRASGYWLMPHTQSLFKTFLT